MARYVVLSYSGGFRWLLPHRKSELSSFPQTEIHIDSDNNYYEVSTYSTAVAGPSNPKAALEKKALERAEINLNDCLACR